jgi:hypothetical protein
MPDNQFTAKWKMDNPQLFTAEKEGYIMYVHLTVRGAPTWYIYKDGEVVDGCYFYTPTKCELSARVQAERVLNKILKQNKQG